jgi:hypothetical protein
MSFLINIMGLFSLLAIDRGRRTTPDITQAGKVTPLPAGNDANELEPVRPVGHEDADAGGDGKQQHQSECD